MGPASPTRRLRRARGTEFTDPCRSVRTRHRAVVRPPLVPRWPLVPRRWYRRSRTLAHRARSADGWSPVRLGAPPKIDVTTWSDAGSRDAIDLVAASAAELVGFEVATVSVVRDEHLYTVSVHGSEEAAALLTGWRPRSPWCARAGDGRRLGPLPVRAARSQRRRPRRVRLGPRPRRRSTPPTPGTRSTSSLAPLYDDEAELIGLLSIDVPASGRRPGRARARGPAALRRPGRAGAADGRRAPRPGRADPAGRRRPPRRAFATSQDDLESVLDDCRYPLLEGFRADFLRSVFIPSPGMPVGGARRPRRPPRR